MVEATELPLAEAKAPKDSFSKGITAKDTMLPSQRKIFHHFYGDTAKATRYFEQQLHDDIGAMKENIEFSSYYQGEVGDDLYDLGLCALADNKIDTAEAFFLASLDQRRKHASYQSDILMTKVKLYQAALALGNLQDAMRYRTETLKVNACPKCHDNIHAIPKIYGAGRPDRPAHRGEAIRGSCIVDIDSPNWLCIPCKLLYRSGHTDFSVMCYIPGDRVKRKKKPH